MFSKMLFSGLKIVQCFLASAWSSQRPSFAPLHEIPLNPPLANRRVQKKEQHEQTSKARKQTNHMFDTNLGNCDNHIVNFEPTAERRKKSNMSKSKQSHIFKTNLGEL